MQAGQTLYALFPASDTTIPTAALMTLVFISIIYLFHHLPASWIQEVIPPYFQTQQHRQGLVFPGGKKREYHSQSAAVLCCDLLPCSQQFNTCVSSGEAGQYRCSRCCRWKLLHHPGSHLEHHPLLPGTVVSFPPSHPLISKNPPYPLACTRSFYLLSFPLPLCASNEVKCKNKVSASQPVHFPFIKAYQGAACWVVYVIHSVVHCLGQAPCGNAVLSLCGLKLKLRTLPALCWDEW